MKKVACKFCRRDIVENAVICAWCGKNQKNGKTAGISKFTKTGEIISSSVSKAKIVMKVIMGMVFLGLIGIGGFYGWEWYQANGGGITATIGQQMDQLLANVTGSNQTKTETAEQFTTTEPEQDTGPLTQKLINFPINITEAENSNEYRINHHKLRKITPGTPTSPNRVLLLNWELKVTPPLTVKVPLRMKIYKSSAPTGEYKLVYDRVAQIKQAKGKSYSARFAKKLLELPASMKNAPERVKKSFLARRKKHYEQSVSNKYALFNYSLKQVIAPNQLALYHRVFLCRENGSIIKELKLDKYVISSPDSEKNMQSADRIYNKLARSSGLKVAQGDVIYSHFDNRTRQLIFSFRKNPGFKITGFSIGGVKQIPTFIRQTKKENIRRAGKMIQCYISKLSLGYPFGGLVKLDFKYLSEAGQVKRATMEFFLPPPPPIPQVEYLDGKVKVSWDDISKELPKKYFTMVPHLELSKNRKLLKTIKQPGKTGYLDEDISPGELISYNLVLKRGIYNAVRWSSDYGIEQFKKKIQQLINPFVAQGDDTLEGVSITIPSAKNRPHPVRIELMKNSLRYENTGITAHKLLATVINRVKEERDMVFYDRETRNYIMDEKYFALSAKLRQQFLMKEADYAIQLKDYSRQDGNGVELWLFKKHIAGRNASKKTVYWRIADLPISGNEQDMAGAVNKLITKVRQTLEFKTCADSRQRDIKPTNIICPPLRPVNEQFVIRNYEAISESLFLSLGENSETIKILSQSDWDEVFRERIRRFDKGHSVIDKMVREILLTGRMWRSGKNKSYYVQASDAFTGEVLGSKIFTGKIRNVATELSQWAAKFRLSNEIKADFHISEFHYASTRRRVQAPWRLRNDLLQKFGRSIYGSKRSRYIPRPKTAIAKQKSNSVNFYDLVKRQWKDGYRAKAIQMLEAKWKSDQNSRTGRLLCEYYSTLKDYKRVLELYDTMLEMDDCPKLVSDNYNKVMKLAKNGSSQPNNKVTIKAEDKKQVFHGKSTVRGQVIMTTQVILDDNYSKQNIDYAGTGLYTVGNKKIVRKFSRRYISNYQDLKKLYFIDRDIISAEWAPDQPCRTNRLVLNIPGKPMSKGILSPVVQKYGIWLYGARRGYPDRYSVSNFFEMKNLYRQYYTRSLGFVVSTDEPTFSKSQERQIKAVCKPSVIVFEQGWNSVDPFSENLDKVLAYTRLGYFFKLYSQQVSGIDRLYSYSKVRAFFELKNNPKISLPRFNFINQISKRGVVAELKSNQDMIRYFAYEACRIYDATVRRKGKFDPRSYKLYQILAVEYMAKHNNAQARKVYRKFLNIAIPTTIKGYRESRIGESFLIFMAYRKNKKAIRILKLLLKNKSIHFDYDDVNDYVYTLAQSGNVSLVTKLILMDGINQDIRWFPRKLLDRIMVYYSDKLNHDLFNYLVLGMKNDAAAQKWFLNRRYNAEKLINLYFGKPAVEAYQDWRVEHFKQVAALKTTGKAEAPK
ncbi:MAG: hypothetical protein L3J71_10830 [Victivallaceae bacterium]|nr:hypothetical protein [Victivallaceae bacterium]